MSKDEDILIFLFLGGLALLFLVSYIFESIYLDPIMDRIINMAHDWKTLYKILLLSLFSTLVIFPIVIIQAVNNFQISESSTCSQVFSEYPRSIYDKKLLSKCQYTQPLAKIFSSGNRKDDKSKQDATSGIDEFTGMFSDSVSLFITTALTFASGTYFTVVMLILKKGVALAFGIASSSAVKMVVDGKLPSHTNAVEEHLSIPDRGNKNEMGQNINEDILRYTETIRNTPDSPTAYFNRGSIYNSINRFDDAITDFNEAIRLKPDFAEAYNNRGITRKGLGDFERAIKDFTRSIELNNPKLHIVYNNRGNLYMLRNDLDKAVRDYNKAIQIKPDYSPAIRNLEQAQARKNLSMK